MNKTTLSACLIRTANTPKILLGFSLLFLVSLFNGCALAPSSVDSFIFVPTTNTVPVVTNWTETVTATNTLGTVETRNVVTWATNIITHVDYTVSTNAAAIIQTGSRIGDIFSPGMGELGGIIAGGALALWARFRSKKTGAALTQTVETLLAIIETTKGKAFTDSIKLRLVKDQNAAGVLREIAALVEATVDNEQAKALARTLLETLPAEAQTTAS